MKNLKSIITAFALIISVQAIAKPGKFDTELLKKEIQNKLIFTTETPEKVEVVFLTNTNGEIDLAIVKTNNKLLKHTLEKNFLKLHLDNAKANNVYSVILNLKVQ